MLPVSLDCPFFIALSEFSNVYLKNERWLDVFAILQKHVTICQQQGV
jgi:hypothetical protein